MLNPSQDLHNRPKSSQKPSQSSFLHVKQRLDYYYLPNDFPIQMTSLLEKLLSKLDNQTQSTSSHKQNKKLSQLLSSNKEHSNGNGEQNIPSQAVRHQMAKVIKQNNQLHMDIIVLKEEVSTLKHSTSKLNLNQINAHHEVNVLHEINLSREKELFNELEEIKYKYNELMDFVHNDEPKLYKQYLKRLLKHKNYQVGGNSDDLSQTNEDNKGTRKKRGVTLNQKSHQQRTTGSDCNFNVQFLRQQLANRQKEIKRLQSKLQFDGINMNRILKTFNDEKGKEYNSKLTERINHLEREIKETKDQNLKMKRQGGDKQALRVQLKKNQETIKKLTQQNKDLKRQNKQTVFNEKNSKNNISRKLNQTNKELSSLAKGKIKDETKLEDLQRDFECLESRNRQLQECLQVQKDERLQKQQQLQKLLKQVDDSQMLNEYERQRSAQNSLQSLQRLQAVQRDNEELRLLNVKVAKQNDLLKEAIGNLEKIQDELMRKNNSFTQSTFYDRTVLQQQTSDLNKHQNAQLRSRLTSQTLKCQKNEHQYERQSILLQRCRKECEILKQENRILNKMSGEFSLGHQEQRSQLKMQNSSLRQGLLSEKDMTLRLNARNQELESSFDRLNRDLIHVKDQYEVLKKAERQNSKGLSMKIASLQEGNIILGSKNEEKQLRIRNLQAELIECTQKLRESHRQLNHLDESLHKLNIEKSRLERKYHELVAQSDILKERQQKHSVVKQIQLKSDIEKLYRESQNNKMLQVQLQNQITELLDCKVAMEKQLRRSDESIAGLKGEISSFKEREQLYEMEVLQLKRLANFEEP